MAKNKKKKKNKDKPMTKPLELLDMVFDYKDMARWCLAPETAFSNLKGVKVGKGGVLKNKPFWYFKRAEPATTLAVAHLDTVAKCRHFGVVKFDNDINVFNGQLDDRLGVYVIMSLLPALGVTTDVLLTTDEETGQSTAQYFEPPDDRNYNWIFSFDRMGDDVVMYNYHTHERKTLLEEYGFKVGNGSISDICKLYDMGVTGFNFGVGYHDYHAERAYASMNELRAQVSKFVMFWKEQNTTLLPYTKKVYAPAQVVKPWQSPPAGTPHHDHDDEWGYYQRGHGGGVGVAEPHLRGVWWCDCASDYIRRAQEDKCLICGLERKEFMELANKTGNFLTSNESLWDLMQAARHATGYRPGDNSHDILVALCLGVGNNRPNHIIQLTDFLSPENMKGTMGMVELRTLFFPPGSKLSVPAPGEDKTAIKHPYGSGVYDLTRNVHNHITGAYRVNKNKHYIWDDSLRFVIRLADTLTESQRLGLENYLRGCYDAQAYMTYEEIEIASRFYSDGATIHYQSRYLVGRMAKLILQIIGNDTLWPDALTLATEFFKACYGITRYMQSSIDKLYTLAADNQKYSYVELGELLMWSLEAAAAREEGTEPPVENVEITQPMRAIVLNEPTKETTNDNAQPDNALL